VRILFVASEGLPFSKTGGLADVVEALPKALVKQGHEVAVVLPRYRGSKNDAAVLTSVTIPMDGRLRFPSIGGGTFVHGVRYFFVEDSEYFDRDGIYGGSGGVFPDNAERYSELCRAAIEVAKHIWPADVLHCHDWQTGLLPVLLRTSYADDPLAKDWPVIFTIHNMGYQGLFGRDVIDRAGIPVGTFHPGGLEYFGHVNYLKGGLVYSDYLTTVSRKYAQEIQTPEFGHGLDGVARGRRDRMVGILNGVDYSAWSPDTDSLIAAKYSVKDLSGKHACKTDLMQIFGISAEHAARPIVGIVSRFADQKGFDLIAERAEELMREELLLVVLGSGERRYEELFQSLAARHPGRVGARIAYDNALAHKIEAGADMFLMPSRYEPCGLNQIYSLKYGTVPIVRATGGLDDTIETFDLEHGTGTGFKFNEYSGAAMMYAVRQALHHFIDERIWKRIQLNGMAKDFSWEAPAREYAKLYGLAWTQRHPGEEFPKLREPERQAVKAADEISDKAGRRNQKTLPSSN
jgi:starch synthase